MRRHFPSIKRKKKAGEAKEKEDVADQNESSKATDSTEGEARKKLVRQKPSRQVGDRVLLKVTGCCQELVFVFLFKYRVSKSSLEK